MKTAYLDCYSGISGDMTLASLMDAGASIQRVQQVVHSMGLADVHVSISSTTKKGFHGNLLHIAHPPEAVHRNLTDIVTLIRRGAMSSNAKAIALRLFERLARAEAIVHGTSIDRVHFHEVGAIDSIVDMVGVAVAWDELEIERGVASPVPTGTGNIRIAHGLVSLPAPATAELLKNIPIAPCGLPLEMTTPTGAVILAELIDEFGPMPSMQVNRIGYGAGQREVPDRPNLLRILIGHAISLPQKSHPNKQARMEPKSTQIDELDEEGFEESSGNAAAKGEQADSIDYVWVLETNLDDITGEEIGYAIERVWELGPLDVFTTAISMKKNRPGTLLTVLCRKADRRKIEEAILEHTGSLGLRVRRQERVVLPRAQTEVDTPWGLVPGKVSMLPSGDVQFSPEYDDCRFIARENGLRLREVVGEVEACYRASEQLRRSSEVTSDEHGEKESQTETRQHIDPFLTEDEVASDVNLNVNAEFQQAAFEDREEWTTGVSNGSREIHDSLPGSASQLGRLAPEKVGNADFGDADFGDADFGDDCRDDENLPGYFSAEQLDANNSQPDEAMPTRSRAGQGGPSEFHQEEASKEMFIDEDVWYRWDSSPWNRPTDS